MTDSVVVEGYVKIRDGKKWKTRWVALRKPSPVADCLVLLVFKDKSGKAQGHKARASVTLGDICGLELGQCYEGVCFTLTVLCLSQATLLGFDSRETLLAWDVRVRYSLGEVHRFSVGVLPGTKLESGPATLHLCNNLLAVARDVPPVIVAHWNLWDLRRYGPVPNGFVFEGGAGVFLLASTESEQISFLFDCIVRGISPTRAPFGLRPLLPDPSHRQAPSEDRVKQEAQELEKRLSMLSQCSSTASSIYGPSAAGDDRSISGSSDTSDTSQSDGSIGSRLAIWPESAAGPSPPENPAQSEAKAPLKGIEKLSISQGGGARPVAKAPRQLQEIGRQSSSDSGIATGSHSSYSGSFSSYTGSLDMGSGEDFGSVFSLPPHVAMDLSPCGCLPALGHEYKAPTSPRHLYDSPGRLVPEERRKYASDNVSLPPPTSEPPEGDKECAFGSGGQSDTADRQTTNEHLSGPVENSKVKVAPSCDRQHTDACQMCSSVTSVSKTFCTICSTCGGLKGTHYSLTGGSTTPALPGKKPMETQAFPVSESIHSSEERAKKRNEALSMPKKGREKLAHLLAYIIGSASAERVPEEKPVQLSLYEKMSPTFVSELKSKAVGACTLRRNSISKQNQRTIIYENCLKCQRENCQPPYVVPTKNSISNSRLQLTERNSGSFDQPEFHNKKIPENQLVRDEQNICPARDYGPFLDDECDYEEMNGLSETSEEKKTNRRAESCKGDPAYEITESRVDKSAETEEKSKFELMDACGHQRFLCEPEAEIPAPDRPRGDGVTYVNIPISPTSKKQLNYMELELQDVGAGIRGSAGIHLPPQRKSSTKYAQIDITATQTAHKVATQHALGREEGLRALEMRRSGAPQ